MTYVKNSIPDSDQVELLAFTYQKPVQYKLAGAGEKGEYLSAVRPGKGKPWFQTSTALWLYQLSGKASEVNLKHISGLGNA